MDPLEKSIRRYISFRVVVLVVVFIISSLFGILVIQDSSNKSGRNKVYAESAKNSKMTVIQLLRRKQFEIKKLKETLKEDSLEGSQNGIYTDNPIPVILRCDGREQRIMTLRDQVKDFIIDNGIELEGLDELNGVSLDDVIYVDMILEVIRIREREELLTEDIPFGIEYINNSNLESGTSQIMVKGESGQKELKYKITYKNGNEIKRELIYENVIKEPVQQVVELGTKLVHSTSARKDLKYKRVLDMKSTAYTASYEDTGKRPGQRGFGITCTGMTVKHGVVAVDPRVIPLGSKLYIECSGGNDYGYAVAADTGGAIKGNIIDVYVNSKKEASNWGHRRVKVYIIE